jgi:hypothetical protein
MVRLLVRICQDIVRSDFNQMGSLINNGLLPEKSFLEQYYNTILISWKALERSIAEQRQVSGIT